ncbi:uncharacterized protein ACRADG_012281 isoform 2-T2 [Cochliomyia hominivorax]
MFCPILCCNNITFKFIHKFIIDICIIINRYHDLYIVKPTPALNLGKEELTTVLLVNNENHGRYINVRPEVGLLTSTARTFIQEGVTTEYATQVVGTTLDNGRIYAQYLKKSSRVLYNSGVPQPSVVTSWVGESLQSDALYLPQSHNDLFNADQPDWRAIDDSLLADRRHKDNFIGNTDYVALSSKPSLISNLKSELDTFLKTSTSTIYTTNSKIAYNFVPQLGDLEENARKIFANKVLPIGDLPTYTIKQNYEPSAYLASGDTNLNLEIDTDEDAFGRNPKLIYKNVMQNNLKLENVSDSKDSITPKPFIPVSRHFATVTYYGFADFTTVVGDSVIVFSPSTSTPNVNYNAHVTSIKGEATLGAGLPQGPSVSKVPITIAQDIIEPTITQQLIVETSLEPLPTTIKMETSDVDITYISPATTSATTSIEEMEKETTKEPENNSNVLLETINSSIQQSESKQQSIISSSTEVPVMLSRPSDEEILRIYNALANAEADKAKILPTTSEVSTSSSIEESETSTTNILELETSNAQTFAGATTIFFEDDPFANFVDPSKTSSISESSTISLETHLKATDDSKTGTASHEYEDSEEDNSNNETTSKNVEVTTEQINVIETTTKNTLTSSEKNPDSEINNVNSISIQSSQASNKSQEILPNVLIKEIDPNNDEVPSNCISTSQVFLTQLPKTVTYFETIVVTEDLNTKTEIKQQIKPTFDIKEATKYYCIQATQIQENLMKTTLSHSTVSDIDVTTSKVDQQLETTESTGETNDETEMPVLNSTEENPIEVKTEQTNVNESNGNLSNEYSVHSSSDDTEEEEQTEDEDEEFSGLPDEDEEEIELIYKTLYTTYTYLTTFFHDDATSISSHTEVVTNVMTSTLGISSTKEATATNFVANLNENEINPTAVVESNLQLETSKRFEVPSEVDSLIRTDEEKGDETGGELVSLDNDDVLNKSSETLATFYTTYTYYTTIFSEGETEIMSHTEVITNIKKSATTSTTESIRPTISSYQSEIQSSSISPEIGTTNKEDANLPHIPDLGDLSAITLVTDVRSSSSSGDKQIINNSNTEGKMSIDNHQQQSLYEDQLSSESNTDLDEIIPSATLLLQTSFTTFTYYTTMYSGDKTNVISRLETMTNTVTETLQPSKTIDLEGNSLPITYFTTFTYWTKLAKEGQITTLSREETISNVILPTPSLQETQTQIENIDSKTDKSIAASIPPTTEGPTSDEPKEHEIVSIKSSNLVEISNISDKSTTQEVQQYTTNVLQPTTYYTTYTYYTTSYETDKTITDSRFETVTNVVTPTITLTNSIEQGENSVITDSPISVTPAHTAVNIEQSATELVLYDFKKIIDADGISTIFFTTEIKPTVNSDGISTDIISSTSSLFINEEKRSIQATAAAESSGTDSQLQKQYKTGLVRLIEGTRIANRTTTLYQSKVIGTIIDQRYAQIIESTSSFIFEKTKSPLSTDITPTTSSDILNIEPTQQASLSNSGLSNVEGSILEQEAETTTKPDVEAEEDIYGKTDEKLRLPFQTKKPQFITPLKPFSNRTRPQFAPKKNSSATIITRSDFTPTITATPALKTISRFSSTRRGGSGGSSSNPITFGTSSRRFGRPSKSSIAASSTLASAGYSGSSRNRFSSSTNARGSFGSSSRRLGGPATLRPSFSRPSLFSSGFPGNSRLRVRPTATADFGDASASVDITTSIPQNSQEDGVGDSLDEEDEEENTTESNRRQNNPLLRLRRPLQRPQGFTPARTQSNSPNNPVSLRRNPLVSRGRTGNTNTLTTTTTTTTPKPKPRTFQPPQITQNRIRPTNSLFPPRNIFGIQKPKATTEENKDLSEEDTNENNDDSEYEDDDDEELDGDDEEENNRRRRSNKRIKRDADSSQQNRSNFRNRFRRPKLASHSQSDSKSYEEDASENKETSTTSVPSSSTSGQKTRSRFGARYGHTSSSSTTTATTSGTTATNHKAIRPTRPTHNSGRAQFTLREKDSVPSTTQKGLTTNKRPAFRRPQPGGNASTRRLSSSTAPSSSTSNKRRLKSFNNNDSTTTSRNSVTGRSRSTSTSSGRSRPSGISRESNIGGRSRPRNNHNNNNDPVVIDNSGTITVTHVIPAEVTIPVVNGKVTEYKQVVTAKTSTQVLGPQQYTTTIANNGLSQLVLTSEDTSVNYNGATEVTQYILHETPTTTITFTPTTIRGRKTSFSHVLPSTAYSVEQVVSTLQPQISSNAPLANILLSQLLLGNVGLPAANPLLGALGGALTQPGIGLPTAVGAPQIATPVTEYKTHASTYVTTVFEGQSTVLPVTFQGKKILTTVYDTTAQTITATEFITDTIVTTPTVMAQPQPVVNSLLLQQLLLQQHLQQQQQPTPDPTYPLNAILNSVPPQFLLGGDNLQELEASNNIRGSGQGDLINEDDDFTVGSSVDLDDVALQAQAQTHKNGRKKTRKNGKSHKRKQNNSGDNHQPIESSVITLYVSGRRPGEFSTVLSTVQVRPDSTLYKRHAHTIDSNTDYFNEGSEIVNEYLALPPEIVLLDKKDNTNENEILYEHETNNSATQSLESIVGDVSLWYATHTAAATTKSTDKVAQPSTEIINKMSSSDINLGKEHFFA